MSQVAVLDEPDIWRTHLDRAVTVGSLKTKVINIRGTNGSGKSHLVRQWMRKVGYEPYPRRQNLFGGDALCGPIEYYRLRDGGIVLGSYETACGGCDTMGTFAQIERAIRDRLKSKPPYLIFEGIVVSTVFGTWFKFSQSIGGMTWAFLDTPLTVCIERVYGRNRGARIGEDLLRRKFQSIDTVRLKAIESGEKVVVFDWRNPLPRLLKLLEP